MARTVVFVVPTWVSWQTKMAATPVVATLHSKAGTLEFPARDRLTALAITANVLKLPAIPNHLRGSNKGQQLDGIAFTVKEYHVLAGVSTVHDIGSEFVPQPPVSVCCETKVFIVKCPKGGDLIIKQTKTPCAMCITAFAKYANSEQCTIVVQTDSATDDTTLFFQFWKLLQSVMSCSHPRGLSRRLFVFVFLLKNVFLILYFLD